MTDNYYAILNCTEHATFEELKQSYQKLVKQYHPDKNDTLATSDQFRKIDEAWKVLRDANSRKEYDNILMNDKLNNQLLLYATLTLKDLDFNVESDIYTYSCRCGGIYTITADSITEECLVSCDECSFVILIK